MPALTGAENILLGAEPHRAGRHDPRRRRCASEAAALVERWFPEVAIDLDRPVADLPMADQKVIEIVRALRGDVDARHPRRADRDAAGPREGAALEHHPQRCPGSGVGVVLISHFLSEIMALSDRITVLRDGRRVCTEAGADLDEGKLVDLMLRRSGGEAPAAASAAGSDLGATALASATGRSARSGSPRSRSAPARSSA